MTRNFVGSPPFSHAAPGFLADPQLRANLRGATSTIREKRRQALLELPDLEELRLAAAAIKDDALSRLDELVEELEEAVTAAGGHVHFAADAARARELIAELVIQTGASEVVKVKSMTSAEVLLNEALEGRGIYAAETDLAELIVQLGDDLPSHIVVPAIHRNRAEIRDIFLAHMGEHGRPAPEGLTDEPSELARAARAHLRQRFLKAEVGVSGANFAIAKTGSMVVVESEGNGRMCLTLPRTLISLVGIDKVLPDFSDLEVFLQLLARSATGERMNPYTSVWTGVHQGDGPETFHLVLLDNGRSSSLADKVGRQALRCIRCAACLNVCPVYERVGGHAYGSVYPGPIGAVLAPQLDGVVTDSVARSLPFASTLCGACAEVCPVRIDIPRLLVHLRARSVDDKRGNLPSLEHLVMAAAGSVLSSPALLGLAERSMSAVGKLFPKGKIGRLPGPAARWTAARDAPVPAPQSFRHWWRRHDVGLAAASQRLPRVPGTAGALRRWACAMERCRRALQAGVPEVAVPRWAQRPAALPPGRRPNGEGSSLDDKSRVLGAVRRALADAPYPPVPMVRPYRRAGELALADHLGLFVSRLEDYGAHVRVVQIEGDVPSAVSAALVEASSRRVVVPQDLPARWLPGGHAGEIVTDGADLTPEHLDKMDATLTGCAVAIAETGTIILDGGEAQGRRALSLIPDHLVVIILSDQVMVSVPDAVARLRPTAPQTWVSGPSATSDIELSRIEGVHGPRRLDVIMVMVGRAGDIL